MKRSEIRKTSRIAASRIALRSIRATERRLIRRSESARRRFARLREQPLQFGNAGAAIGAGFQLRADLGGRTGARRDRVADGGATDAETGANYWPFAREPVRRPAG